MKYLSFSKVFIGFCTMLSCLFLFNFSSKANNYIKVNSSNYNALIKDSDVPIYLGVDLYYGLGRVRDALVPYNKPSETMLKKVNVLAYANSFAFLCGHKTGITDIEAPRFTIMPLIHNLSANISINLLVLDRNLWRYFNGYPLIGLYLKANLLNINRNGKFFSGGLNFELHKDYKSTFSIYPNIMLGIGYFTAPVASNTCSHPFAGIVIKKNKITKFQRGIATDFNIGLCWRVLFNQSFLLNIKFINQYILLFPFRKYIVRYEDNTIYSASAYKRALGSEGFPNKKVVLINSLNLSVGVNYIFQPSNTRYKHYEMTRDSNILDIGIIGFLRKLNPFSSYEKDIIYREEPKTESAKSYESKEQLNDIYPGFGIYGIYSFKSAWAREYINKLFFDNISFLLGAELNFDSIISKKQSKNLMPILENTKFSLMTGLGLCDLNFIKLKFLLGYDIISFDKWGNSVKQNLAGDFFICPEIQILPVKSFGITLFSKLRPTKNITKNGGGGMMYFTNYDLLYYEVGIKIGVLF